MRMSFETMQDIEILQGKRLKVCSEQDGQQPKKMFHFSLWQIKADAGFFFTRLLIADSS